MEKLLTRALGILKVMKSIYTEEEMKEQEAKLITELIPLLLEKLCNL